MVDGKLDAAAAQQRRRIEWVHLPVALHGRGPALLRRFSYRGAAGKSIAAVRRGVIAAVRRGRASPRCGGECIARVAGHFDQGPVRAPGGG